VAPVSPKARGFRSASRLAERWTSGAAFESVAAEPGAGRLLSEDMLRLGSAGIFSLKFPDHQLTRAVAGLASRIVNGK